MTPDHSTAARGPGGLTAPPGAATPGNRRSALRAVAAPAVLLVLAVTVAGESLDLGWWVGVGPGPGFFPLVLSSLLGVLAVCWAVTSLRPAGTQLDADPDAAAGEETSSVRHAGVVVLTLLGLAVLVPLIGYQLAMTAFLLVHLKVLGKRSWLLSVLVAAFGGFGVFVLFTRVLAVNLPAASIGFLQGVGL